MAFIDLPQAQAFAPAAGSERIVTIPLGSMERPAPSAPVTGRHILLAQNESEGTSPAAGTHQAGSEEMTFWEWLWDYLYNGASITAGIGTRQAELKVTRKSDEAFGKLVQRDDVAYFFSYSTRPSFFGTTKLGYTFMLNYTIFDLDKQEVAKNVYQDLGTRIRGRTAYVVPSFFYQWGQHQPYAKYVRLGVGVGLGVAKYEGDIILTESTLLIPDRVSVSNGSYDLKAAIGGFLEARYRFLTLHISGAGPSYEDDIYKYDVRDIAVYLGLTYTF